MTVPSVTLAPTRRGCTGLPNLGIWNGTAEAPVGHLIMIQLPFSYPYGLERISAYMKEPVPCLLHQGPGEQLELPTPQDQMSCFFLLSFCLSPLRPYFAPTLSNPIHLGSLKLSSTPFFFSEVIPWCYHFCSKANQIILPFHVFFFFFSAVSSLTRSLAWRVQAWAPSTALKTRTDLVCRPCSPSVGPAQHCRSPIKL